MAKKHAEAIFQRKNPAGFQKKTAVSQVNLRNSAKERMFRNLSI